MLPIQAHDLLPQQFPFQMVDTLLKSDEAFFATSFQVMLDNVMVSNGHLSEGGMLENMAQTAACGTGYFFSSQGKSVPVGFIGAIKRVNISRNPAVGELLHTEVVVKNQIGNASIADAKIEINGDVVATCELTIFLQT